jgi:hypothetical protein
MIRASVLALLALLAAGGAAAQPAYKCWSKGQVVYTDVPCAGARAVDAPRKHSANRHVVPPQDRAKRANRARLSPENQRQCEALDAQLREQQAALARLPQPVTAADEREWLQTRLRHRQKHC